MNKKTLFIVGGAVLVLMVCACVSIVGYMLYKTGQEATGLVPTIQAAVTRAPANEPTSILEGVFDETPAANEPAAKLAAESDKAAPGSVESNDDSSNLANQFLIHLGDRKYDDALGLTNSFLRNDGEKTKQTLRALVEDKNLEPMIWEWTNIKKNGLTVRLEGVMHFADKRRGVVTVEVMNEDGKWGVSYLDLNTDGSSIDPGPYNTWSEDRKKEEVTFAKGAGNAFLTYWGKQDFDGTWMMTAQPMKASLDNQQQKLQDFLTGLKVTPKNWTWDEGPKFIEQDGETPPVIEFKGTVNYQEGSSGPLTIQLKWENDYWSVLYLDVKAN